MKKSKRGNHAYDLTAGKIALRIRTIEEVCRTIRTLIKACGVVGSFYCLYLVAGVVADTTTVVTLIVDFLASVTVSKWAAWAITVLATGWGFLEGRNRRRVVIRMGGKIKELEERWDRRRTTSQLTDSGRTHPEDD